MREADPSADSVDVAAIIVNYRTPALVLESIAALRVQCDESVRMVARVVDNGSGDGSLEELCDAVKRAGWESWVEVVDAGRNGGFSAGNNVGIRSVRAHYYWLINSDAMVREGALQELLQGLEANPGAAMAGPRLEWPDGRPQESCFRFRTPLAELVAAAATGPISRLLSRHVTAMPVSGAPLHVDWVSFACVLIRAEALHQVGLLDEGYFMYFEDMDLCWRLSQENWSVVYWPAARAVHLRGQSGNVKQATALRRRRPRYYYESRARALGRCWGRRGLVLANLLWMLGRGVSWLRELAGTKAPHTCERELTDIWIGTCAPIGPPASASESTLRAAPGVQTPSR